MSLYRSNMECIMPIIKVQKLTKKYTSYKANFNSLRSFIRHFPVKKVETTAVNGISFSIEEGDIVAFIGPNGAGKSTTIKMLTGILVPTSGTVEVMGSVPYENRKANARLIGLVFGQRTQLWWDLPLRDSLELSRFIYGIPQVAFRKRLDELVSMLEMESLLEVPVRKMSLGQRIRGDLALSILHDPQILFLDEPTIGLDIIIKEKVCEYIKSVQANRGTTIVLTTHDLRDVEKLCNRLVIVDKGYIIYDGSVIQLKKQYGDYRDLTFETDINFSQLTLPNVDFIRRDGNRIHLRFDHNKYTLSQLLEKINKQYKVSDIVVEEPEIETIIKDIYRSKANFS